MIWYEDDEDNQYDSVEEFVSSYTDDTFNEVEYPIEASIFIRIGLPKVKVLIKGRRDYHIEGKANLTIDDIIDLLVQEKVANEADKSHKTKYIEMPFM